MSIRLLVSLAIPLVVVTVLFLRTGREQPLRHRQLWITPAVAVGSIAAALAVQPRLPLGPTALVAFAGAALVGLTTGTLRAGTVRMRRDPATGTVLSQTQSYAVALFVLLLAIRLAGQGLAADAAGQRAALTLFDAALLFAAAMVLAQRVGIFRRYRRLRAG